LNGEIIDILICEAGARRCALRLDAVIETMRPLATQPVESDFAWLTGVALVRGQPCPVLDLSLLLGEPAPVTRWVTARVGQAGERVVALAVSRVDGVSGLPASDLEAAPPLLSASSEALQALAVHDGHLLSLLSTASLLKEEAWAALEAAS
jgi:purine-binding chemotaxis protein CheW